MVCIPRMRKISRRDLIFKLPAAALLVGVARSLGLTPAEEYQTRAEGLPDVVVSKGAKADSAKTILQTALDGLGGIGRFVKPGQTVAIKPNATWAYPPHTASSTDPDLLRALVEMVKAAGAKRIIVMDHCSIDPGTAESLRVSGIGALLDNLDVEQVFPDRRLASKDVYTQIELPQGIKYQTLGVIKAAVDADVRINLAVAKSHNVTKMSLCMKHMMGFMEEPQLLHAWLYQGIGDLNTPSSVQAQLHILEAIRVRVPFENYVVCAGPETDETDPRVVKRMDQVIAGVDPCLVDAYACINYYSMRPRELAYLNLAAQSGVGDINVDQATQEGRLQVFNVGDVLPTQTPEPSPNTRMPTITAAGETTLPAAAVQDIRTATVTVDTSTATPLPTAAQDTVNGLPTPGRAVAASSPENIVDPRPFLSGTLIPAAAVVTGAGLVALQRMKAKNKNSTSDEEDDEHNQE